MVERSAVTHPPPQQIVEFAARTVDQVRATLDVELGYDSETLPIVDHYLRSVPRDQNATVLLIAATAGAYFGEVVRQVLGGRWEVDEASPMSARLILSWGLSFSPTGIVAAAIMSSDEVEHVDTGFHVPSPLRSHLQQTLERMSPVTDEEYYSLCGRFDTLEHLQEVVLAIIARERAKRASD